MIKVVKWGDRVKKTFLKRVVREFSPVFHFDVLIAAKVRET